MNKASKKTSISGGDTQQTNTAATSRRNRKQKRHSRIPALSLRKNSELTVTYSPSFRRAARLTCLTAIRLLTMMQDTNFPRVLNPITERLMTNCLSIFIQKTRHNFDPSIPWQLAILSTASFLDSFLRIQDANKDNLTSQQQTLLMNLNAEVIVFLYSSFYDVLTAQYKEAADFINDLPLEERLNGSMLSFASFVRTVFPDDLINTMDTYA